MASDAPNLVVMDRISDILVVLSEVSTGTFFSRLPELPDEDNWCILYRAINDMAAALAEAHEKSERYQAELQDRLETIEKQRTAIRELSTPVIEVWEGVLCLPVVGVMDTSRSAEMSEALLRAVVERKARCTIIDVTGIDVMDTATVDHFLRMAKSVRLLGAECIVTGVSPGIAQTIVHMGVDLSGLTTRRSLRDALTLYVRLSPATAAAGGGTTSGLRNAGR
jgi:rsbT co-antagonist protein RsbR